MGTEGRPPVLGKGCFPLLLDALLRIFSQKVYQGKSIFGFLERLTYQTQGVQGGTEACDRQDRTPKSKS